MGDTINNLSDYYTIKFDNNWNRGGYVCGIKETIFTIDKVFQNDPVTVVIWNDGSKTIVKAGPHDIYNPEVGILWAFYIKHANGSKTKLQKTIMSFMDED